jgi:GT2 family glycosyltransferase
MGRVPDTVTVAIPTLNAGPEFARTLAAVRSQHIHDRDLELLICDSGSSDQTVALARSYGAEVIEIPPEQFSHGGTRNLLMSRSRGDHVAFLTQDAVPAATDWLSALIAAFALAPGVGLAFGPYRPRPEAGVSVARDLTSWFESFSDGGPRIDTLPPDARNAPPRHFMGHLGFFTDANGCVARAAWREVPFREVAYAEDHLLAQDMLRAGYAKVYVPGAAVIHSHDYSPGEWLRRSFDEARAVRAVYGFSLDGRSAIRNVRGGVSGDRRWAQEHGGGSGTGVLGASLLHHGVRAAGTFLGGRAERLPASVAARLSLEHRA